MIRLSLTLCLLAAPALAVPVPKPPHADVADGSGASFDPSVSLLPGAASDADPGPAPRN